MTIFVEQRAFEIVVTLEREGGFSVSVPELSGCFTQGETLEEVKLMSVEAIAFI